VAGADPSFFFPLAGARTKVIRPSFFLSLLGHASRRTDHFSPLFFFLSCVSGRGGRKRGKSLTGLWVLLLFCVSDCRRSASSSFLLEAHRRYPALREIRGQTGPAAILFPFLFFSAPGQPGPFFLLFFASAWPKIEK